jgi:tetratricopeptide (TPR) repeat protein
MQVRGTIWEISCNDKTGWMTRSNRYRHSVSSDPSYLRAFFNLTQTITSKGEDEEAKKHFQRVLKIDPDHSEAIAALEQQ